MSLATRSLAVIFAFAITACGPPTSSRIASPSGLDSYYVACRDISECAEEAARRCPNGYDTQTHDSDATGRHIVVLCRNAAPVASIASREDARTCEAASAYVEAFATYWASRALDAKRLAELASKEDFIAVCRELPERVQRCMHDKYRAAHEKPCEAVLGRMSPNERAQIDSLFFELASDRRKAPVSTPNVQAL